MNCFKLSSEFVAPATEKEQQELRGRIGGNKAPKIGWNLKKNFEAGSED